MKDQTGYLLAEVLREFHDGRKWGGDAHDDLHSSMDGIALAVRHLGLAVDDGDPDASPDRYRRQLIRVAALMLAAAAAHDRKTGKIICPKSDKGY